MPSVGCVPAHERLEPLDAARSRSETFGWKCMTSSRVVDRRAQVGDELQALGRAVVALGGVELHAAAARAWPGTSRRRRGAAASRRRRRARARRRRRCSRARRAACPSPLTNGSAIARRRACRRRVIAVAGRRDVAQHDRELVAAEARDGVGLAQRAAQARRRRACSSSSPSWWPSVSLISLKRSRSSSITATVRALAAREDAAPARGGPCSSVRLGSPVSASCSASCWWSTARRPARCSANSGSAEQRQRGEREVGGDDDDRPEAEQDADRRGLHRRGRCAGSARTARRRRATTARATSSALMTKNAAAAATARGQVVRRRTGRRPAEVAEQRAARPPRPATASAYWPTLKTTRSGGLRRRSVGDDRGDGHDGDRRGRARR